MQVYNIEMKAKMQCMRHNYEKCQCNVVRNFRMMQGCKRCWL